LVSRTVIVLSSIQATPSVSKYSPPPVPTGNTNKKQEVEIPIQKEKPFQVEKPETPISVIKEVSPQKTEEKAAAKETVRIGTDKLNSLLLQAEELITAKAMFKNNLHEFKQVVREYSAQAKSMEGAIQVVAETNQPQGESFTDLYQKQKETAKKMRQNFSGLLKNTDNLQRGFSRMIDDLLLDVRKTLLVPFASLLNTYPKLVRDLAKDQKKEVNLTINGTEVEIDRRILEELKDPLNHIIRNSLDHGIEPPEQRISIGKPTSGELFIDVSLTNDRRVNITVRDDGGGISANKVLASALKEGLISAEHAAEMSEKEKLSLIFRSGVSTSSFITNISGRGLGMAIVAEKVAGLGGTIDMESKEGVGTQFLISVPLTLATFRGVVVNTSGYLYMIPINAIERVLRIRTADIHTIKAQETIIIEDRHVGLMRLANVLGLSRKQEQIRKTVFHTLVLAVGQLRMAFIVDEIIGEQEGIVKSLGTQLLSVRNITGATVLGDGKVIPVVNATELIEHSLKSRGSTVSETLSDNESLVDIDVEQKRILVAEDSLTSRSLLRNIFEAAGYFVKTTVDGAEAFATLNSEKFDLLVSDIEMPRMNGFELTTKIREDEKLSSLPIVLITSLDAAEDRQKGLEAGANAYFVKSSFDQTSIIELIERLI
jgi:two-component system, chemotaxis family, sensor kinase CheA